MQIPQKYPQFEDELTLIIVSGKQAGDLHLARDGKLETVGEIRIEKPQYSDREGHFKRRSKGKSLGSGSPVKQRDEKAKQDYLRQLQEGLKELRQEADIASTILLAPSQHKEAVKQKLPTYIRNSITSETTGNFVGEHPKDILDRIADSK